MSEPIRTAHSLVDTATDKVLAVASLTRREAADLNRSIAAMVVGGARPRTWI